MMTCLLCGHQDRDVSVGLVEIPEPERRVVSVSVVAIETSRGPTAFDQVEVRESYAPMPRCRDRQACAARVRALPPAPGESLTPAPDPAAHDSDDEEGPTWAT